MHANDRDRCSRSFVRAYMPSVVHLSSVASKPPGENMSTGVPLPTTSYRVEIPSMIASATLASPGQDGLDGQDGQDGGLEGFHGLTTATIPPPVQPIPPVLPIPPVSPVPPIPPLQPWEN